MATFLLGAKVTYEKWEKGRTFSDYLESRNISKSFFGSISKEDQKFLTEIYSDCRFYELKDDNGQLLQSLIPISEEMQIHLFKSDSTSGYSFDIIPIVYQKDEYFAKITIESNPYSDTLKSVGEVKVAERISHALQGVINARRLHKGDEIAFTYTQKTRLDKLYSMPDIRVARVQMGKKVHFIYVDEDGYGYEALENSKAGSATGKKRVSYVRKTTIASRDSWFAMPLRHVRITSRFSYRRWHPRLHRYRPHHGTDFGARRGTPILAVNFGKVIFSGRMGGYGKVVKIKHRNGYVSLYAHQSRIRVKRGQYVKRGQIIGYVGNTGISTGPHLHFGLRKRGKWVNPMRVLHRKAPKTSVYKRFTKYEKVVFKDAKKRKEKLLHYLSNETPTYVWHKEISTHRMNRDKKGALNEELH